jgi:DnaJ-class molecular chaperone
VLGVSPSCSGSEIKQAYYELARRHHPDAQCTQCATATGQHPGAEHFRKISESYRILSSESERRQYDVATRQRQPAPASPAEQQQRQHGAPPRSQQQARSWRESSALADNWWARAQAHASAEHDRSSDVWRGRGAATQSWFVPDPRDRQKRASRFREFTSVAAFATASDFEVCLENALHGRRKRRGGSERRR